MFNYQHPLMGFMEALFDYVLLTLLTVLCCVPVVTLGPALCAFFHTGFARKRRKGVRVTVTYFRSFRDSFLQGLALGLPMTVLGGAVVTLAMWAFFSATELASAPVKILCVVSGLCIFLVLTHGACVIGCFRNSFGENFRNALTVGLTAPLRTLFLFALTLLAAYLIALFVPLAVLVLPALAAASVNILFPAYRRYFEQDQDQ